MQALRLIAAVICRSESFRAALLERRETPFGGCGTAAVRLVLAVTHALDAARTAPARFLGPAVLKVRQHLLLPCHPLCYKGAGVAFTYVYSAGVACPGSCPWRRSFPLFWYGKEHASASAARGTKPPDHPTVIAHTVTCSATRDSLSGGL